MAGIDPKQFELDRIKNMLSAFGWSVGTSNFMGNTVEVRFDKTIALGQDELGRMDADKIINMLKSFGWVQKGANYEAQKVSVTFTKDVGLLP